MGRFRAIPALVMVACSNPLEETKEELSLLVGSWEAFDRKLAERDNAQDRDILLLALAVEYPRHAQRLCKRTTGEVAREKCRQVIGRPHLGSAK